MHANPNETDMKMMMVALKQARLAAKFGDIPVGAVIAVDGQIIARGYNKRENKLNPLGHAELDVIAKAARKLKRWRLNDCTLYVTLEPCVMCAGAIVQSRIGRVVYGAVDPKAGAVESVYTVLNDKRLNHRPVLKSEVLGVDCSQILRDFFSELRKKKVKVSLK